MNQTSNEKPPLEIHIANADFSAGSVPLTWCVSKEGLQVLALNKIIDPIIVICVTPVNNYHIKKERRYVVPLKDLMTYVDFHYPGKNRIFAFISNESLKEVRKRYLTRSDGSYETDIVSEETYLITYRGLCRDIYVKNEAVSCDYLHDAEIKTIKFSAPPLDVEVPQEFFAKEPPEWEKKWVNWLFTSRADNQCEYRRRRILAYTIQPLLMIFNVVMRFLFLMIAALIGARDISIRPLIHPMRYDFVEGMMVMGGGSIFFNKKTAPFLVVGTGLSCLFASLLYRCDYNYFDAAKIFLVFLEVLLFIAITASLVGGLIYTILRLAREDTKHTVSNIVNKTFTKKEINQPNFWYMSDEEQLVLTCETGQKKAFTKVSDLPAKHRTIKLRYYDLKSKVCKPFSG